MPDPDDEQRAPDPVHGGAEVGRDENSTASAYAPPPRRGSVWRNPFLVGVLVIVAVALVVFAVGVAS